LFSCFSVEIFLAVAIITHNLSHKESFLPGKGCSSSQTSWPLSALLLHQQIAATHYFSAPGNVSTCLSYTLNLSLTGRICIEKMKTMFIYFSLWPEIEKDSFSVDLKNQFAQVLP